MIYSLKNVGINSKNGKSIICLLLCLLTLFSFINVAVCSDCGANNQNVKNCLKKVKKLQDTHDLTEYNGMTQLNDVCSLVDQTDRCLLSVGCDVDNSEYQIADWQGIKDSFHYLCGVGKQDFLAQRECWDSDEAGLKIKSCVNHLNEGFESGSDEVKCTKTNTYIDCIKDTVAEDCNAQASNIIKTFVMKRIHPAAKLGGCELDEEISSANSTVLNSTPSASRMPNLILTVFISVLLGLLVFTF